MAQKNKVKELVGRGLGSYHTKALQQMDRIEKKNKEQNHKISILSNELDNDYLTKTEEGSVISLEHSKEGMVYLDELQGNTLVNYCTDGSKEMTLNGDIDVEGTFVTTTEGVDNGKVDVMCEGNTLVNLNKKFNSTQTSSWDATNSDYVVSLEGYTVAGGILWYYTHLKPSTTYTMIVNILECVNMRDILLDSHYSYPPANSIALKKEVGVQKIVFNTRDSFEQVGASIKIATYGKDTTNKLKISKHMILLEGDWTNKEIPPYFEGMKSVGQDDDNGHKIEISSQNKNLFSHIVAKSNTTTSSDGQSVDLKFDVEDKDTYLLVKTNKPLTTGRSYTISFDVTGLGDNDLLELCVLKQGINRINIQNGRCSKNFKFEEYYGNGDSGFYLDDSTRLCNSRVVLSNFQIEEGDNSTAHTLSKSNKKEILLNEPLRSLPNGVKDKFVKIGGKWFIERNCAKAIIDGTSQGRTNTSYLKENEFVMFTKVSDHPIKINGANLISASYKTYNKWGELWSASGEGISNVDNTLGIGIRISNNKTGITSSDTNAQLTEKLLNYFQANPLEVIYEPKTPTYEPIENVELTTYLDITHISNNSIIPCNMKIQNTGYNAIIKPSTLYTVALDTNKSGTIGMNLGGMKTVTTNNVATITTPAILSDDSLRLFGKGIKGSKVRLLEGDKTNWIPSHFEGMKSSFEDKLQEDGTYKMEILMNNKNLFDANCFKDLSKWNVCMGSSSWKYYPIYIGKNKKAYMKRVYKDNLSDYPMVIVSKDKDYGMNIGGWMPIIHGNVTEKVYKGYILPDANGFIYLLTAHTDYNKLVATIENCIISTVDVDYIEQKSNKIQFSLDEPLRKYDGLKFKNGRLMIERNYGELTLNRDNYLYYELVPDTPNYLYVRISIPNLKYEKKDNIIANISEISFDNRFKIDIGLCYYRIPISYKNQLVLKVPIWELDSINDESIKRYIESKNLKMVYELTEPTYEEIPFELQKIILEGYENGTLFFDTNIPPTSTVTYAGETPILKATKLNKTEVSSNTDDINDNIIPYLMDMDYRVVCLQLQSEGFNDGVAMARLFGGTYEMIKRDILSKRLTREEYGYRLADYFNAGKLTEEQVRELEELR